MKQVEEVLKEYLSDNNTENNTVLAKKIHSDHKLTNYSLRTLAKYIGVLRKKLVIKTEKPKVLVKSKSKEIVNSQVEEPEISMTIELIKDISFEQRIMLEDTILGVPALKLLTTNRKVVTTNKILPPEIFITLSGFDFINITIGDETVTPPQIIYVVKVNFEFNSIISALRSKDNAALIAPFGTEVHNPLAVKDKLFDLYEEFIPELNSIDLALNTAINLTVGNKENHIYLITDSFINNYNAVEERLVKNFLDNPKNQITVVSRLKDANFEALSFKYFVGRAQHDRINFVSYSPTNYENI